MPSAAGGAPPSLPAPEDAPPGGGSVPGTPAGRPSAGGPLLAAAAEGEDPVRSADWNDPPVPPDNVTVPDPPPGTGTAAESDGDEELSPDPPPPVPETPEPSTLTLAVLAGLAGLGYARRRQRR